MSDNELADEVVNLLLTYETWIPKQLIDEIRTLIESKNVEVEEAK